jgi:hypothetical protein
LVFQEKLVLVGQLVKGFLRESTELLGVVNLLQKRLNLRVFHTQLSTHFVNEFTVR